jgi:Holliday junction resolvase
MSNAYERELKGILSGDVRTIERISRSLNREERDAYCSLIKHHFLVVRAGGSLGIDIVAVRGNFAFPIEVKSSSEKVLRFSRSEKLSQQAKRMREMCEQALLVPTYAFRLKNARDDPWRLFTLPGLRVMGEGVPSLLFKRLPKIGMTEEGNGIMRWEDGMKLSKFLDYFMHIDAETPL